MDLLSAVMRLGEKGSLESTYESGLQKMSKTRKVLGLVMVALMQGCAVNPPTSKYTAITQTGVDAIRGKSVRVKAAPTPEFVQFTNGDQATLTVGILFGPIGGGIGAAAAFSHAKSRGQSLVAENAIPDPTPRLVERVEALLGSKYGSSVGDSGYELDIATVNWGLAKDDVVFGASAKLTDGDALHPRPLAVGECKFSTKGDQTKPSLDDLLMNRAEKLKQLLDNALNLCVQDFETKVFL